MHSIHRDLEAKYRRALNEIASLQNLNVQLLDKNNELLDTMTKLKKVKIEQESKIS